MLADIHPEVLDPPVASGEPEAPKAARGYGWYALERYGYFECFDCCEYRRVALP